MLRLVRMLSRLIWVACRRRSIRWIVGIVVPHAVCDRAGNAQANDARMIDQRNFEFVVKSACDNGWPEPRELYCTLCFHLIKIGRAHV